MCLGHVMICIEKNDFLSKIRRGVVIATKQHPNIITQNFTAQRHGTHYNRLWEAIIYGL